MADRMIFGTFTKFNLSHYHNGTWRLDEYSRGNRKYSDIESWVELAKMSEDAKMDFLMWADDLGSGGHFDGDIDAAVENGIYAVMDNSLLPTTLSRETKNLGFVITSSVLQDHPFNFARRMSTMDQITGGRVGWNIVTGVSPGFFMNFGLKMMPHEERYAYADEYMDVLYKLWEGSWERDAVIRSFEDGRWVDPAKVHTPHHVSEHFSVRGPHQVEPSPQGSPVLFQAGTSSQGIDFAVKNAEIQFIGHGQNVDLVEAYIKNVRAIAARAGRDPQSLVFAPGLSMVVGETEKEAMAKRDMIVDAYNLPGIAAKMNNVFGFNLKSLDEVVDVHTMQTDGIKSSLDNLKRLFPDGSRPTAAELIRKYESDSLLVGTPEMIADHIEALQGVGVGAILTSLISRPGTLRDFVEMVAPELKKRGLMQTEYDTTKHTLRDRLFGDGDLLPESHTGASYRPNAGPMATM